MHKYQRTSWRPTSILAGLIIVISFAPQTIAKPAAEAADANRLKSTRSYTPYLQQMFTQRQFLLPEQRKVWTKVQAIYAALEPEYGLLWLHQGQLTPIAEQVLSLLDNVEQHGLQRLDYRIDQINILDRNVNQLNLQEAVRLDTAITASFVAYLRALTDGRIEPYEVDQSSDNIIAIEPPKVDSLKVVRQVLEQNSLAAADALEPQHPQYQQLKKAYAYYQWLNTQPPLPPLMLETVLKPGQPSGQINRLVQYLQREDYLQDPIRSLTYTPALVTAVKRYQQNHGLKPDGVIGPKTLAAFNQSLTDKQQQIAINMDRWRWLPRDLGDDYLLVNVPEFKLRLYGQEPVQEIDVIVGRRMRPTPVFKDRVTHVVFSPYWNVPRSITTRDLLPKLQDSPTYLTDKRYEVLQGNTIVDTQLAIDQFLQQDTFPYRLRQKPGANNALGQVKFMFPNQYAIYLHDTPADALFERTTRTFSSGCIRVEEPVKLAQWLLDSTHWNTERIQNSMLQDKPTTVHLEQSIPVYIIYLTTFVDDDQIHFLPDIYRHDAVARSLLQQEYRNPKMVER